MTRFEIQELASQNQDGVTFRALDKSTNQIVSLRRFFPFGQDEEGGEGFNQNDGAAFSSACQNLSKVRHPALRNTIFGDTDPVDGMPFLVTEWVEGESLADVLGNNTMDPTMIIGLVRQALDVCMTLSVILESEAVWIDTKLEAIIVSNPSENPTFSFRICPFKWLGTQSHTRDLTGIVSLVEALMGWNSKPVSDFAGLGLGGWLKQLRQNPQMGINDALLLLPDTAAKLTAETKTANTLNQPVQQPYILPNANQSLFTTKRISIMALSACFTGALIFFLYQNNSKKLDATTHNGGNKNTKVEQQASTPEILPIIETTKPTVETTTPKRKLWSPSEISTAAWYDASNIATITSSNGLISQWNDISGNENHATQPSSALKPQTGTRTINDLNAIDFDADKLSRVELDMTSKAIFAVVLADNTGEGGQIFSHSKFNNQLRVAPGGQIRYAASPSYYDNSRASTDTLSMNKPGLAGFILNSTLQFSVNGIFDDTLTSKKGPEGTLFNQFGARGENTEGFDGLIGEIIITDSIPDTDTRQKLEGYLAHKWGLTENLPADHTYKLSPPSASGSEVKTHKDPDPKETEPKKLEPTKQLSTQQFPFDIPVTAWYDASTATIKDGSVSIVNAASTGNEISGPASIVANGIGKLQAVQFNGINQYLTGKYTNTGATLSAFYVGKSLNTNQAPYATMMSIWESAQINDWDNPSSAVLFSQSKALANSVYTHRVTNLSSVIGELTTGFLTTTVFDGSTNTLYLNGTPSTSVASINNFNASNVILGAKWEKSAISAPYWNGNFGEVIICNTDLSTSDRQKIEGYLAHKWSLLGNLPADHPYKLSAPTHSTSKPESLEIPPKPKIDPPKPKPDLPKTEPTPNIKSWSPIEIPTAAWYDAADTLTITAKSGAVSQWRDKSGNNLNLGQSTATNQPTTGAKINGLNALDFTGDVMTTANNPFKPTVSNAFVIAVHKVDSLQEGTLFSLTGSESWANRWNAQAPWNDKMLYFDCGGVNPGSNRVNSIFGVSPGNVVLTSFYSSTTNNVQQVYKNGSLLVGDSSGHAVSTVGNISVGGVEASYQDTTIGEFIIINGTVDDATRQLLEGYLAHKWKLTGNLPAGHPYKSAPPTNATPGEMTTHKAEMIVTKVFSPTPLTYSADVSKSDLLTGLTPVTTGWNNTNNASALELTDGIHGMNFKEVAGDLIQGAYTTIGATAIYNLGTGANGLGYDIASMQSIADWCNAGFGNQAWTVAVKLVGGGDFVDLATVDYRPLGANDGGTTKVTLTDASGVIAKGVESIKITANSIAEGNKNKFFVWRELDVFGASTSATPLVIDVLTPQNTDYIKTLKEGDPVTLQGIVKSAKFSSTEKSIYISFSDPAVETDIRVVIHGSEYEGGPFTEEEFAKLIDRDIVFNGAVYTEKFNDKPPFVKITAKDQMKRATTESTQNKLAIATNTGAVSKTDTGADIPILSPNDINAIAKLESKQPASVKGVVKSVHIPKPGAGLYISFDAQDPAKQIKALLYQKGFEGGPYDDAQFKKIEEEYQKKLIGKTVTIQGTVHRQGDKPEPHFIFVSNRDQIKIEDQQQKTAVASTNVIYTPEDINKIKLLEEKSPVKLLGILNDAKMNASRNAIIFNFSKGQIHGVVNKLSFKDDFDPKSFVKFVGKKIVLNGVLTNDRSKDLYLIEIDELSDISIAPK